MSRELSGNLKGLAPSERRQVERLFTRRLDAEDIVSLELAREIYSIAHALSRRIGVLVSREGHIEEVVVGTRDILYLPDLGRYRLGHGRLRRLRLIFSDLTRRDKPSIPADIYTDLEKLRLDAVVGVRADGNTLSLAFAHLVAERRGAESNDPSSPAVKTEIVPDLTRWDFDFSGFIEGLEQELGSADSARHRTSATGAVLIGVYPKSRRETEASMLELRELARTAGVEVLDTIVQRRDPDPRTLLGRGKLEEVVLRCLRLGAELVIFDTELTPSQWRAVTNATELKIIDRSMLILDIFAQRAKSSDGRLQVELAQLKYNLPRLVEKDAGLSRLSGGIGGRGPGETKLEIGRRRARDKISDLERRISKLSAQRELRKKNRKDRATPLVAIIGYTNAGKSTLFNTLTKSSVVAEDKLFATLDPTHRRVVFPQEEGFPLSEIIFSDTVGFIRELPKELVNAFRSTLEELYDARLLLHVIDGSDPQHESQARSVLEILQGMELLDTPRICVLNKCDRLAPEERDRLIALYDALPISATNREGILETLRAVQMALLETGNGGDRGVNAITY